MKYDNLTPLDKGEVLSEEQALAQLNKYKSQSPQSSSYIHLKDVSCIKNLINPPVEHYESLYISKNLVGPPVSLPIDHWIHNFNLNNQKTGHFLASLPLTCNILKECYKRGVLKRSNNTYETINPSLDRLLCNYLKLVTPAQNTIIHWDTNQIINYPHKAAYLKNHSTSDLFLIRQHRQTYMVPFSSAVNQTLINQPEKVNYKSSHPNVRAFVQSLTCLEEEDFQNLADYIANDIIIHLPKNRERITTVAMGLHPSGLNIYTSLRIDKPLVAHSTTTKYPK